MTMCHNSQLVALSSFAREINFAAVRPIKVLGKNYDTPPFSMPILSNAPPCNKTTGHLRGRLLKGGEDKIHSAHFYKCLRLIISDLQI